uniref:Cryptide Pep-20 n=1 Tax=Tityus obscurus TaxID=1221240 RepID=CRY20_TITOB
HERLLGP